MSAASVRKLQVFYLVFTPFALLLAIALNRWYACAVLVWFASWLVVRWLPGRAHGGVGNVVGTVDGSTGSMHSGDAGSRTPGGGS